jgi:hypothetical protein
MNRPAHGIGRVRRKVSLAGQTLALFAAALLGPPLKSQSIPVDEISGPDDSIHDEQYGVTGRYPEDWLIRGAQRWGDQATTIYFAAPECQVATPSLYYRIFHTPLIVPADEAESWLRKEAERKVDQRVKQQGLADYANRPESFQYRTIGGRAALSWMADYTSDGGKWTEYLTAILSENGLVLFFLSAPADKIDLVMPKYGKMIETLRMP